jgi:sucrose-6-phosphate hydrolase SacC (GH32 family)
MKMIELRVNGRLKREFPVQLAEDSVSYWIYVNVDEFRNQKLTLSSHATQAALDRIYQDDRINGEDSLYKESHRPQFHFTVKRGWSNDVNGPIFFQGQYHLFWQAFPFGLSWNTGFMYWGHAVSSDLLHWKELEPAMMLDSLGSPWSGSALVDKRNDGGWGKDALVVFYTAFDRVSFKQVQCLAYSTDGGKTFTRYAGNPVIDSNWELDANDTRDPKVFWHEASGHWVMVLFEKEGLSIFNSSDLRHWKRRSHLKDLWECPDLFELPVDGDPTKKKWVIHGGSSAYYIGSFDGERFIPETEKLIYAEGNNDREEDILYAAQSFENMPDGRRVQMAWGRISHEGMPFTQMMLFPTEFSLKTTEHGVRLFAKPIAELERLHGQGSHLDLATIEQANSALAPLTAGSLHIKLKFKLEAGRRLSLRFQGNEILSLSDKDVRPGLNELEVLVDRSVAEIFINNGERYLLKQLGRPTNAKGLEFDSGNYGPTILSLDVHEVNTIW